MSDIVEMETPATVPALSQNSPASMMLAALKQGASLEQVEKMMDLQERWEANEARKAYNDALASFKAEAVKIIKNKQVQFKNSKGGVTSYKHAELSDVVNAVGPALSKHGFSWSWIPHQEAGRIRVTCTLRHRLGHTESVSLEASPDDSGGKNSIQAIISTTTYLERHTLKAICGLSEQGEDTDGEIPQNTDLRDGWVSELAQVETLEQLESVWKAGCTAIENSNDLAAFAAFRRAYGDKKKHLEGAEK
ncbi:MAG TPA: single-stranded DNA-binding protein [Advenella kashmirensis]|uniref:Single-stranded DNA-binding protein n=1 Tax=Advenella kashmirensis TaxID=310575 RepID=A0A356LA60_9BURK|nr:single-stranded DNA-binding protein [Advenella kashmirensis]